MEWICLWISVKSVIDFTGLKPKHFRLEKGDNNGLDEIVSGWIEQSESLIRNYTNNFDSHNYSEIPEGVKNICLRLTANMVALAQARRDTPVIKVNDWSIKTVGSDIFTDDLKEDLAPWVRERKSYKSDKVEFFAITGD